VGVHIEGIILENEGKKENQGKIEGYKIYIIQSLCVERQEHNCVCRRFVKDALCK
jgi:hypothetical protein